MSLFDDLDDGDIVGSPAIPVTKPLPAAAAPIATAAKPASKDLFDEVRSWQWHVCLSVWLLLLSCTIHRCIDVIMALRTIG